jgi:LmbE family N-acetylglucosaminyl deacetylase
LSDAELAVWTMIETPCSLDAIRAALGPSHLAAVDDLWLAEMVEVAMPVPPGERRRVLVIEPHADDAALSIGGLMWQRRSECEFTVANVASRSNFTSYYYSGHDYFNVDVVSELRRRESELFCRMIGGRFIGLGVSDAPLRYDDANWSASYFRQHRQAIAAATSRTADKSQREHWLRAMRSLLQSTPFDELWMPLGSPHVDHRLTTWSCLTTVLEDRSLIQDRQIRLYQEVPYAAKYPHYTQDALQHLASLGVSVSPTTHDISAVMKDKLRLVSVYGSQFKLPVMQPQVEAAAADTATGGFIERTWSVSELPVRHHSTPCLQRFQDEQVESDRLARWLVAHRNARSVRIILQVPAGRWDQDIARLSSAFPLATFDVLACPESVPEINRQPLDRMNLRVVGKGARAWLTTALTLAIMKRQPTLMLVSRKWARQARLLSMAWGAGRTAVLTSLDRLHDLECSEELR